MKTLKVGDRVVLNSHVTTTDPGRNKGTVTGIPENPKGAYNVRDDNGNDRLINVVWLERETPDVIHRVESLRDYTDILDEESVNELVRTEILYHNQTYVYDDHVLKIYHTSPEQYMVHDQRSATSLIEQFPRST